MKPLPHFKICWPVHEGTDLKTFGLTKQDYFRTQFDIDEFLGEREKESLYNFYTNLCEVLSELGIKYEIVYNKRYKFFSGERNRNEVRFSYHCKKMASKANNNDWTVHTSGTAGYFTVDKVGYAGFSMLANHRPTWEKYLEQNLNIASAWSQKFCKDRTTSDKSRNKQSGSFSLKEPYLFIAGQLSYDSVLSLTKIKQNVFYQEIASQAEKHGLKVVYKPHPAEAIKKSSAKAPKNAIISNDSIQSLISGSTAVALINSGVGIEALMYKKPIYMCGSSDYMHECKVMTTVDEIKQLDFTWNPNSDTIDQLLYYLHVKQYVDCYSKESIKNKILAIIENL